ncbi:SLC13 family permease [Deinococcus cellulosilyticus]|uniref:Putative integral membrane protein n=1 Tax=Deinococcus cellulosilyticus (strain DSM 18568 / NBRC 106333 / KACC 11606 / 5516J-15) TaxID=1223518 RepID=A0A511N650_DEIC1|nr:SLC13 family permease [Deinococcus cellulosilyticus]GEM48340.1 putative integral membrane protein [Deinococcus cellulosilyticus NBRC 106333 = KACC 11606]
MDMAVLALVMLVLVLTVGAFRPDLNAGVLSIAAAFLLGAFGAGLTATQIADFLPSSLILTLVGVSLFFELLRHNGTLDLLARWALKPVRGDARWLPVAFFLIAFVLSALGPGNIAATALIAPVAMASSLQLGVSPLLMAIVVCTGANAGTFSPVAVTGSINTELMRQMGLSEPALPLQVFWRVAVIQTLSAVLAYLLFHPKAQNLNPTASEDRPDFSKQHLLSLGCMAVFIALVVVFHWPASYSAILLSVLLMVLRAAPSEKALETVPWAVVVLIAGISVLLGVLEHVGSLEMLTSRLSETPDGVFHGVLALVAGLASVGSSSSGVVMPLFIPMVPGLVPGGSERAWMDAVIAIDVGAHMVDVSPLSTLGALCLAALPEGPERQRTFRHLLLWGLMMAFLGALLVFVVLDLVS